MAHLALFRKYRSQDFGQLSGQDHVSRTLRNALRLGRTGQAYLFCGPRGTGKTSTARIFAKALNCVGPDPEHPLASPPEEPCNRCRLCLRITDGSCFDVNEMDAASHTGVDNIREAVIGKVGFAPVEGRRKVYIIDEVHKLSDSAFDALLKVLEEPPPHLVFILATTDPHEVKATIVSRCQRFDFRRITQPDIFKRLQYVCGEEDYRFEPEALEMVAQAGDGSLRDALVILEQAAAYCEGHITTANVVSLLGITDRDALFRLADTVFSGDVRGGLTLLDTLIADGKDLVQLARDLLGHVRALLVTRVSADPGGILKVGPETLERYRRQAEAVTPRDLMSGARILMDLEQELKDPAHARLNWEVALIRWSSPQLEAAPAAPRPAVAAEATPRPAAVAEAAPPRPAPPPVEAAAPARRAPAPGPATPASEPPAARFPVAEEMPPWDDLAPAPPAVAIPAPAPPPAPASPSGGVLSLDGLRAAWPQVLASFKRERKSQLHAFLVEARPARVEGDACVLAFAPRSTFHKERVEAKHVAEVTERLAETLGHPVRIRLEIAEAVRESAEAPASRPETEDAAGHKRFVQEGLDLFNGTII